MKSKRMFFQIWLVFTAILALVGLTACSNQDGSSSEGITVTFKDAENDTVLKEERIEKGGKATSFTPEKEGYEFLGWYGTPNLSHEFDFEAALNTDTQIFAAFTKFEADDRSFAIVGFGKSPLMLESEWGNVINQEHILEKAEGKNEYKITLDLYEGDQFQFAINSEWENQRGFGYLDTTTKDGEEYFTNAGSLGDTSQKRSNIKVEVEGNYTFILTTNPSGDTYDSSAANYTDDTKEKFNENPYDKITWTYNGDIKEKPQDVDVDFYIKGAEITNWQDKYNELTKMVLKDNKYTLTTYIKQDDEILFTSGINQGDEISVGADYIKYSNLDSKSAELFTDSNGNMKAKKNGTYTFSFDAEAKILTVEYSKAFIDECEFYLKGSFSGTNWSTEGDSKYQLKAKEGTIYTFDKLTLKKGDELGIERMIGNNQDYFYSYNNLSEANQDNANDEFETTENAFGGGNIVAKNDGEYSVEFNAYSGEIVFKKLG